MASWAWVSKQTKLKWPHVVNPTDRPEDTISTLVNESTSSEEEEQGGVNKPQDHFHTLQRSHSIRTTLSHVMAVADNMAVWHWGQQGVNGRKHFFRCSFGCTGLVEWLGFHGNYRRCVGSSHPSHRGRKSTLHKARQSSKIYKYINILIYTRTYTLYNHRNMKTYTFINKYLNTRNIPN